VLCEQSVWTQFAQEVGPPESIPLIFIPHFFFLPGNAGFPGGVFIGCWPAMRPADRECSVMRH